jgi:ribosomal protein S18 acetylase RimI-like enzyme
MDRTVVIRQAQKSDIAALSELAILTYAAAFGHTFSDADFTAHVQKHLSPSHFSRMIAVDVVLVAEVGHRLIGYVQFGATNLSAASGKAQELRRLYVHPEFQNAGYGTLLMDAALHHPRLCGAACIYLDVWEHNYGAQRFYRRYGFAVIGTRSFAVESGAATSLDLVMVRRSSPPG